MHRSPGVPNPWECEGSTEPPSCPAHPLRTTVTHLLSGELQSPARNPGSRADGRENTGVGDVSPKETYGGKQDRVLLLSHCKVTCLVKLQTSLTF